MTCLGYHLGYRIDSDTVRPARCRVSILAGLQKL